MPKSDAALRKGADRVRPARLQHVEHCCDATTGTTAIKRRPQILAHFVSFDAGLPP